MECVWKISGVDHGGEVKERAMFEGQLTILTCENHYREHKIIMKLYRFNEMGDIYGMEDLLAMSKDNRNLMWNYISDNRDGFCVL